ncbi:MAG: DUF58 domain-containing protein [Actinobacteria bacterium]|nr:DUF58 domain-containing protein [Actinomycetota bacterium]
MQLTTRGWSVVGSVLGLYAAGRALGTVELAMVAAAGVVALLLGVVIVWVARPDVRARRTVRPHRLYAGATAEASIELVNLGTRHTPVLSVTDRFTGRREARFAVPPLRSGESARGAYRIPTARRGVFAIGPLRVGVTDPLGLIRRAVQADPKEQVTVYPRVEPVAALPLTAGRDLVGGAVNDFSRSRAGTEFHSLREYQVGDDLRRVHWRSTARTGQLMIREHDVPWQTRATLLLDDRSGGSAPAAFERMVEAAASVATALHQRRSILRLLTSSGLDTGFGTGHEHFETIMERLAVADPTGQDRFDDVAARLHRQAATGALVVFTGELGGDGAGGGRASRRSAGGDRAKLATLGRRYGFVAAVRFSPNALDGTEAPARRTTQLPGLTLIDVPRGTSFADAWNEAMVVRFGVRSIPVWVAPGRGT